MSSFIHRKDRAEISLAQSGRTPNPVHTEDGPSGSFLCMQLMCSQNEGEVEAVRSELLKAGIKSETHNNPAAGSLGGGAFELWVQDERDFFTAASVVARMQAPRGSNPEATLAKSKNQSPHMPVTGGNEQAQKAKAQSPSLNPGNSAPMAELKPEPWEETSFLLRKEIEEMLECESELSTECTTLRSKLEELEQALIKSQAALAREAESRAAVERALTRQISGLQSALEGEHAQRAAAEAQLGHDRMEHERVAQELGRERDRLRQELKTGDGTLRETFKKLEAKAQSLRGQEAALLKLKKDMGSLEHEKTEHQKALAQASAELALEREARALAERRAEIAEAAQKGLQEQLRRQKQLQQKLEAHWTNLNSLYSKVHAQRANRGTN